MKIVFLDTQTVGQVPNFDKLKEYGELTSYKTSKSNQLVARLQGADVAIVNKVKIDRPTMEQLPDLKLICIAATGMNNIDLEAAAEHNITVKNVAGYSTNSVAQSTFAALLYLLHHTKQTDAYVKSGEYAKSEIFTNLNYPFWELSGKQFGIIGLGNIGRRVATIAEAFNAKVSYYSTSGKNTAQPYRQVSLHELLQQSDVISIHAPLNKNTYNLLNYELLCRMKKNAYLINMGRGGIVNEADLARALNENKIAGAVLDVFEQEPIQADNPLLKIQNTNKLLLTPHIAWSSLEARKKLIDIICENIKNFAAGK